MYAKGNLRENCMSLRLCIKAVVDIGKYTFRKFIFNKFIPTLSW